MKGAPLAISLQPCVSAGEAQTIFGASSAFSIALTSHFSHPMTSAFRLESSGLGHVVASMLGKVSMVREHPLPQVPGLCKNEPEC